MLNDFTYKNLNDNELYDCLTQDNEEALTILYNRYWKRMIYKAALKLDSDTDAEEVVQDTFMDIWNSRHRIKIQYSFQTYIAAIVKYKVMAKLAANKKIPYEATDNVYQLQVPDHSTQQWLQFSDLQTEIESVVQMLPEKCQIVFRMSREDGLSDRKIAEELNISQKTVEAHISKALKYLRNTIRFIRSASFFNLSPRSFIFFTAN